MGRKNRKAAPSAAKPADKPIVPEGFELVTPDARELEHLLRAEFAAQQIAVQAYRNVIDRAVRQVAAVRGIPAERVSTFVRSPSDGLFIAFPPGEWTGFLVSKEPLKPVPHAHEEGPAK